MLIHFLSLVEVAVEVDVDVKKVEVEVDVKNVDVVVKVKEVDVEAKEECEAKIK